MSDSNQGFPPPQDQGGFGQGPQNPYEQPPFGGGAAGVAGTTPSGNNASIALGLSIGGIVVGIFMGLCCFPLLIVSVIMSGIGAYLGHAEISKIDQGLGDPSQRASANGARIVGIIGVVAPVALFIIFLAVGFLNAGF